MTNDETQDLTVMDSVSSAVVPGSGSLALAMMSDQEFESRLSQLVTAQKRAERIKAAIMVKDVDYGVIPHTDKPTLLKPGAEKLCLAVRLVATFEETVTYGDGITRPHISVDTKCNLHLGDADGPIVGQGVGNANSWEKRYRYRLAERACPKCGCEGTIRKSRQPQGGWFCWTKLGGCGAQFADGDEAIEGQQLGQVENPDPFDLFNTLKKIAKKRSHVDATLTATGTSGLFTQDLEDTAELAPMATANGQPQQPASGPAPARQAPARSPRTPSATKAPDESRPSTAEQHRAILSLSKRLGHEADAAVRVVAELYGKPLEQLTFAEAGEYIGMLGDSLAQASQS